MIGGNILHAKINGRPVRTGAELRLGLARRGDVLRNDGPEKLGQRRRAGTSKETERTAGISGQLLPFLAIEIHLRFLLRLQNGTLGLLQEPHRALWA